MEPKLISPANFLTCEAKLYLPRGRTEVSVRNRAEVDSPFLRQPELVPPMEIREVVTAVVRAYLGIRREEAVTQVAHRLGFRSTTARFAGIIKCEVGRLLAKGELVRRGNKLWIIEESVT